MGLLDLAGTQITSVDEEYKYEVAIRDLIADYEGGEFSLFFANCESQSAVSMDMTVSLYNVKANGKRDFLSVGEDELPTVYMVRAPPQVE
jgi:hypothetical protein